MAKQPPLFLADGRPAYAIPSALEADLRESRLVFLREMFYGSVHPPGLFLGALEGYDQTGRSILRAFLYDCASQRVAKLADMPANALEPTVVALVRPPFVISIGRGLPPNYGYATIRFQRTSGQEIEYATAHQRSVGLFWADTATLFPDDPTAKIIGVAFYHAGITMAIPGHSTPLAPDRLAYTLATPIQPSALRYPDDLPWQSADQPDDSPTVRLICRDASRTIRPTELAYLEGTD